MTNKWTVSSRLLCLFCLILLTILSACSQQPDRFTVEMLNKYTPVKQQGGSQLCWAYAMLAAIETEHIMRGDSVELSVAWVDRMMEREPRAPRSKRGVAMTLVNMIERHGVVPFYAMPDTTYTLPHWAFLYGVTYTPRQFAHSVCEPGEYIGLGCNEERPPYTYYIMDSPDNWEQNQLFNMPRDSLLSITERAVRSHHGVCWEGDISERGFDWKRGVARTSLWNGRTTDDHCMAIVGIAHDDAGRGYFIMKNSWGTANDFGGLMYMSYDYFLRKTLAIVLPRKCAGVP